MLNKKGVALITVMVMLLGIAGLGLALLYLGRVRLADSESRAQKTVTYYLAETGLADALWYFNVGGHANYYSDSSAVYKLDTPDATGQMRKVGEYIIKTSGAMLKKNGATFNDPETIPGSRIFITGNVINFLIWSGELVQATTTGSGTISDGTTTVPLTLSKTLDLNPSIAGLEGFTASYTVPGALLANRQWNVTLNLQDTSGHTYSVSGITLKINGVGTASATGIRKIKSAGFFPGYASNSMAETTISFSNASPVISRFVVVGDTQGASAGVPVSSVLGGLATRIAALNPKPDLVFFLGDLAYSGGTTQLNTWKTTIAPITGASIPYYTAKGNHEMQSGAGYAADQQAFIDSFTLPTNGPYAELAYSVENKNALLVCLDSNYYDGATYNANQITPTEQIWLSTLLGNSTKKFKFIFTHEPAYPIDSHIGSALDYYEAQRNAFWNILDTNQATIFFSGHEHLYSRWRITSAINPSWKNNVLQIICGGGVEASALDVPVTGGDFNLSQNHFVVVDLNNNDLLMTVYNSGGSVIDTFSLEGAISSGTPGYTQSEIVE